MSTIWPAWERVLACHPFIFPETFSKISLKAPTFDLPKKRGKPRYFEKIKVLLYGRILLILLTTEGVVFLLKCIEDFEVLIACPDQ
jgi:hypothetical protein